MDAFLRHQELAATVEEREAPDFQLTMSDATVGVEVTELFISPAGVEPSPVARESAIARVVSEAKAHFERHSPQQLRVAIGFIPRFSPTKLRRSETARAIANELLEHKFAHDQVLELRAFENGVALPEEVAFISAHSMPPGISPHWFAPQAGWVAPLVAESLQDRIAAKAARLASYRSSIPLVWLLLVSEGRLPSQFFDPALPFDPSSVKSPFDRTFLFSMMHSSVIELGLAE